MTVNVPEFVALSKEIMPQYVSDIVGMSARNIDDEYWSAGHFLTDLPGKWELSFLVLFESKLVGFLIASRKEASVHIHKFVVDGPMQRSGLGSSMLRRLKDITPDIITLKVKTDNKKALAFYLKEGFVQKSLKHDLYTLALER